MRINLTKKDLVNSIYMQVGFSKQISENLIEDFLSIIVSNITKEKKTQVLLSRCLSSLIATKKIQFWHSKIQNKYKQNNNNINQIISYILPYSLVAK